MGSMKEIALRDYISKIDFQHGDWGLNQMKVEMRSFLGEEPAIDIIYEKDVMISEVTGEAKEFKKISKISIVFTDLDDKFKKLEFLVSKL